MTEMTNYQRDIALLINHYTEIFLRLEMDNLPPEQNLAEFNRISVNIGESLNQVSQGYDFYTPVFIDIMFEQIEKITLLANAPLTLQSQTKNEIEQQLVNWGAIRGEIDLFMANIIRLADMLRAHNEAQIVQPPPEPEVPVDPGNGNDYNMIGSPFNVLVMNTTESLIFLRKENLSSALYNSTRTEIMNDFYSTLTSMGSFSQETIDRFTNQLNEKVELVDRLAQTSTENRNTVQNEIGLSLLDIYGPEEGHAIFLVIERLANGLRTHNEAQVGQPDSENDTDLENDINDYRNGYNDNEHTEEPNYDTEIGTPPEEPSGNTGIIIGAVSGVVIAGGIVFVLVSQSARTAVSRLLSRIFGR